MRYLIIFLLGICSCTNNSSKLSSNLHSAETVLDSVRMISSAASILFHHQVDKMSLVSKDVYDREGLDSLFKYIGQSSLDTTCNQGGLYNHFGQISLYEDTIRGKMVAEIHFVLEGNCTGFYLETDKYLKRFYMTAPGKKFLSELYNANKDRLR